MDPTNIVRLNMYTTDVPGFMIGKEADKLDEQFHLGLNEDAAVEYGASPDAHARLLSKVQKAAEEIGQRRLAKTICISRTTLGQILKGEPVSPAMVRKICRAIPQISDLTRGN